jgi:hypothetical protein
MTHWHTWNALGALRHRLRAARQLSETAGVTL